MSDDRTLRRGATAAPVTVLRADVVAGPDLGQSHTADSETLAVGTAEGNDLVLGDPTVSRYHCELRRTSAGVHVTDLRSTNGTVVGEVRLETGIVPPGATLTLGDTQLRVVDGAPVDVELHGVDVIAGVRGNTPGMRRLMAQVSKLATTDAAVLLQGESGTGKERIAHALHELGGRAGEPFVTVDCGAIAPTLVASELFGHERGAFTGADRQHAGAFEQAAGGTIFLDEVGELPDSLQASLLGVLERKRFKRLGGRDELAVDVRVISATHRDLRADVNAGAFRLDLYYRLAVVTLPIPPLRERTADLALLIEHFLGELGDERPVASLFPPQVITALERHRWPGNVRELRNFVEATLAMGEPPELHAGLGADDGGDVVDRVLGRRWKEARAAVVDDFERRYLERLIEAADGNVSQAARVAGLDRTHLGQLLRRHGLK